MKRKILLLALGLAFILAFAACGGSGPVSDLPDTPQQRPDEPTVPPPPEPERVAIEGPEVGDDGELILGDNLFGFPLQQLAYEGVQLEIWTPWPGDNNENPTRNQLDFEEWTGASVNWTGVPLGELQEVLVNAFAAGMGPDAFRGNLFAVPGWAHRNLVQPWSDYMDFHGGPSASNIGGANIESFSIGDDIFGLSSRENFIWNMQVLFYSRAVMDAHGLEDPLEVFLRGDWTYDVFADYVQRLTFDSGVGHIDHFGIAQWANMLFSSVYTSNGGNVVTIIDGQPTFSLHHHESVSALNWFFEEISPFRAPTSVQDPVAWFWQGAVGFYLDGLWFIDSARMMYGNDLSFVPWPRGPELNTPSNTRIWADQGWTWLLAASSQNPQAMTHFFEYDLFPYKTNIDPDDVPERDFRGFINEDFYNLVMEWQEDMVISNAQAYGDLFDFLIPTFRWPLENHEYTPAVLTQRIAPEAQAIIDESLRR